MSKVIRQFLSVSISAIVIWTGGQGAEAALFLKNPGSLSAVSYQHVGYDHAILRMETQALSAQEVSSGARLLHHSPSIGVLERQDPEIKHHRFGIVSIETKESGVVSRIAQNTGSFIKRQWAPILGIAATVGILYFVVLGLGPAALLSHWIGASWFPIVQRYALPIFMGVGVGIVHNLVLKLKAPVSETTVVKLPRVYAWSGPDRLRQWLATYAAASGLDVDASSMSADELWVYFDRLRALDRETFNVSARGEHGKDLFGVGVIQIPQWYSKASWYMKFSVLLLPLAFSLTYHVLHAFFYRIYQEPMNYEWFNSRTPHIRDPQKLNDLLALTAAELEQQPPTTRQTWNLKIRYVRQKTIVGDAQVKFVARRMHMKVLRMGLSYLFLGSSTSLLGHGLLSSAFHAVTGGQLTIAFLVTAFLMAFALNLGTMFRNYVKAYAAQNPKANLFAGSWYRASGSPFAEHAGQPPLPSLTSLNPEGLELFLKRLEGRITTPAQLSYVSERLRTMHANGHLHNLGLFNRKSDEGERVRVEIQIMRFENAVRSKLTGHPVRDVKLFHFNLKTAQAAQREQMLSAYFKSAGLVFLMAVTAGLLGWFHLALQRLGIRKINPDFTALHFAHGRSIRNSMIGSNTMTGEISLASMMGGATGVLGEGLVFASEFCALNQGGDIVSGFTADLASWRHPTTSFAAGPQQEPTAKATDRVQEPLAREFVKPSDTVNPPAAGVAPIEQKTTMPKLMSQGTGQLQMKIDKQHVLNKATDNQATAQTNADKGPIGSILMTQEKGPRLSEFSTPGITFTIGGDGAITQHEDRQDSIKGLDREQKEADQIRQFDNAMFDGYNRFVSANADIKTLTESLNHARDLASRMTEESDALDKSEANTIFALERDLEAAKVAAQDGFDSMRKAMQIPLDHLPASLSPDVPDTAVDWGLVRDLLSDGKAPDPDALATALNIANTVDHTKTAIEVPLRSLGEKIKPANWTINLFPLFRSFTYWDLMSVLTPNFVTSDKFDGPGELSLLTETKNSFLTQRAQRFSDLNGTLQTLKTLSDEVKTQEHQADAARVLAEDESRTPAERQHFNHEAAQADELAQQTLQRANEARKVVMAAALAAKDTLAAEEPDTAKRIDVDAFVKNAETKSSDELKAFAKQVAQATYAAGLQKAFETVKEEQKSVRHPKPGSRRERESKALLKAMDELEALSKQPIDETKDAKADLDNGISAAERNALSPAKRKAGITAYASHVTQATSNQIDAATMKNKSPAVGPTVAVVFPLLSRSLKTAQSDANSANEKLAKLQKQGRLDNDSLQDKISGVEADSMKQLDEALDKAQKEAHTLSEQISNAHGKQVYSYRESLIAARRAALADVKTQIDNGAVPLPQDVNAPSVDQLVANHALARANFQLAMHPAKSVTVSGTSLEGTRVSFNYVTGLFNDVTWKPIFSGVKFVARHVAHKAAKPDGDEQKALEAAHEFELTAKDQINHIKAAHGAALKGLGLYQKELAARQESLRVAQALEAQARQQNKSQEDILAAGAATLQRQGELVALQREVGIFKLLSESAEDEYRKLNRVLGKEEPIYLSPEEKGFRTIFSPFFQTGPADSIDVDKTLADLRADLAAHLAKMPATFGLTGSGAPYFLLIQDADAPPQYRVAGFHTVWGFDADGRQAHKESLASDKDNAEAAQADAHEKSDFSGIQDEVNTQMTGSIAKMSADLKDEIEGVLKTAVISPEDRLVADALRADLEADQSATTRLASDLSQHVSAKPIEFKATPEDVAKAARVSAERRYPEPGPAVKKGKIPSFTMSAGAHGWTGKQFTFAGITANVGKVRFRRVALTRANLAKKKAQDAVDVMTVESHRVDRVNQITSLFRHIQKVAGEMKMASEESTRARAVLSDEGKLLAVGAGSVGRLADAVQNYREAEKIELALHGDLDKSDTQFEHLLVNLTTEEKDSFHFEGDEIKSPEPSKDRLSEADLAARVLSQKLGIPDGDRIVRAHVRQFIQEHHLTAEQAARLKDISDVVNIEPPAEDPRGKVAAFEANIAYALTYVQATASGNPPPAPQDGLAVLVRGDFDPTALGRTMAEVRHYQNVVRDAKDVDALHRDLSAVFEKYTNYASAEHSRETGRMISVLHALWVAKHPNDPAMTPEDIASQLEIATDILMRTVMRVTQEKIPNEEFPVVVAESFRQAQEFRDRLPKPLSWPELFQAEAFANNSLTDFTRLSAPWPDVMKSEIELLVGEMAKRPPFSNSPSKELPVAKILSEAAQAALEGTIHPADEKDFQTLGAIVYWIRANMPEYGDKVKDPVWSKGGAVDKLWNEILKERKRTGQHLDQPNRDTIYPSDVIHVKDLIARVFEQSVTVAGLVAPEQAATIPRFHADVPGQRSIVDTSVTMGTMIPAPLLPFALVGSLIGIWLKRFRPRLFTLNSGPIMANRAESVAA